eukprot:1912332-Ditylum_brightwellii.AAC.1
MSIGKADRNYARRDGAAVKKTEMFYPQLLGEVFIVNSPSWVNTFYTFVRSFLPRRVKGKITLMSPRERPQDLKLFLRYISKEDLPERFGGNNKEWPLACAGTLF